MKWKTWSCTCDTLSLSLYICVCVCHIKAISRGSSINKLNDIVVFLFGLVLLSYLIINICFFLLSPLAISCDPKWQKKSLLNTRMVSMKMNNHMQRDTCTTHIILKWFICSDRLVYIDTMRRNICVWFIHFKFIVIFYTAK